jgi:enoyl-CoA hydratase/carnithine racemase
MSDLVLVTDAGPVRTIRMNRPDKKNALTMAMYDAMAAAIETSGDKRCLLIAGGPSAFCAGNDIGDFLAAASGGAGLGQPILRFLYALARSEKPLVAGVRGNAVGIGTTMLLHCDHVVAGTDAHFVTPFVGLGLVPEAGSSLLAPRLLGNARAFSLLVMGKPLNAGDAKAAGLVNTVVAPEDAEDTAMKAAQEIAALPPQAVIASRRLMRGEPDEIVARIDAEAEEFKARLRSAEAQAAFMAFMTRKR